MHEEHQPVGVGRSDDGTNTREIAYEIDRHRDRIDMDVVWGYLSTDAYWGRWRDRATIEAQVAASGLLVGAYEIDGGAMVGFARALTDGVALAYLADVFVLPGHQGHGLGKRLVAALVDTEPGARLRWMLHTVDAHGLYRAFGFREPDTTYLERPGAHPAPAIIPTGVY